MNFEVFHLVMKHCVSCLIYYLPYYFRFMMSFSTCLLMYVLRTPALEILLFVQSNIFHLDLFAILVVRVLLIYIVCNNLIPIILNQMYLRCLRLN